MLLGVHGRAKPLLILSARTLLFASSALVLLTSTWTGSLIRGLFEMGLVRERFIGSLKVDFL